MLRNLKPALTAALFVSAAFLFSVGILLAADRKGEIMDGQTKLTLLQINDSHAYLNLHQEMFPGPKGTVYRSAGGYARIAAIAKQVREETKGNVLFCDCGDTFFGTYPAQRTQGEIMVPVLNALGLEAMTPHWEFAFGPKRFRELAARLNFPVLAINIYEKDTGKRVFPPYIIKEVADLRVGMIGVASNIVDKTMPPSYSEGLRFTLGREELPGILAEVRGKADLVVLVSHLGFPQDMKLLSEVPGVDVCLSGHTHNRLYEPARVGKTLVIQSGCHGSFVGRLDLEVKNGQIVNHHHELIEVAATIKPDPEVDALIQKLYAPFEKELATEVGETTTPLNRGTMLEATTDNLLLKSLLEATGAEIAFSNGWRWGAPVLPGKVTLNDLYDIVAVNPPVSTTELTGKELLAMLEENLERTFAANAYDQMGGYVKRCAGLTLHVKIENPLGYRIQKLYIGKEEVRPDKVYRAAFITQQGVPAKYGTNRRNLPEHAVDALRAYLAKHRPAKAELTGSVVAE